MCRSIFSGPITTRSSVREKGEKSRPWWLKIITALLFLNTVVGMLVWEGVSRGWWSSPARTAAQTYEIVWRGGAHTFVTPAIGRAFDAFIPVQLALVGIAVAGSWWRERRTAGGLDSGDPE